MRILAVCTGRSAGLRVPCAGGGHETVVSAIDKRPVSTLQAPQPVRLGALGFEGDEQVDLTVHGGLDKAVYLYPSEHYAFWRTVCGQAKVDDALPFGSMGENLAIEGLLEPQAWVGDHLAVGEVVLRVESPRQPCYKFNARLGFAWASKMMVQSGYTGFYCAVVRQGKVAAGDVVRVVPGDRVVSIDEVHRLSQRGRRNRGA